MKRNVLLAVLMFGLAAYGQTSRGTVSGAVTDSSGAVVPGSLVELTNLGTRVTNTSQTNRAGIYRFDAVDPGRYRIGIRMDGFNTFVMEDFPVEANRTVTIDAELAVGGIEEDVTITGTAETALIKDAPLRGGSIPGGELTRLPWASVNPYYEDLFPGVVFAGFGSANFGHMPSSWDHAINGQRPLSNNYLLDGTDNNFVVTGGAAQPFDMLDAIQETSVQTSNFGAEFGRAGGGVVNIVTRSGTDSFHGTVNWRFKSQALDSIDNLRKLNTPAGEKPELPVYTQNIYGFTLGGPVVRQRTFFFGGFQLSDRRSTGSYAVTVPTDEAVTRLRALFPDNPRLDLYLRGLGDTRGMANPRSIILGEAPATGMDRGSVDFATAYIIVPVREDKPQWIFRLDHNWTERHRQSFRYIYDTSTRTPNYLLFPGYYNEFRSRNQNFLLSDSYTFNPTWTNEFRFSYSRTGEGYFAGVDAVPEAETLPSYLIPNVSSPGGLAGLPAFVYSNKWLFQETQTKQHGRHAFRFGFELLRQTSKERGGGFNDRGVYFFTDATNPSYSAFANFLDDFSGPSGFSTRNFGESVFYPDFLRQAYFFQDAWKLRPSLTITLGLRYENYGSPGGAFKYPAFAGFDPAKFLEPNHVNADNNNFAPSFGFAWSPGFKSGLLAGLFGDGKTVWRGGFQIGYETFSDVMLMEIQADAPNSVATYFGAGNQARGAASFSLTLPTEPRPVMLLDSQDAVFGPDIRNPYTERWSFGFQRQLPLNMVLDLAYVGSASHKLLLSEDVNVRQPNGVRLYPDFGVRQIRSNSGNSNYHSMQLRVERKFANRFFLAAHYTWSKAIDSLSEIYEGINTRARFTSISIGQGGLVLDRGPGDYDRSHVFNINYSIDIPGPENGFWGHLAGGWTLVGPSLWGSTGAPYTVLNGADRNNDGIAADRPDIGNPNAPVNTRAVVSNTCSTGYLNPDSGDCVTPDDVRFIQGRGLPNGQTVGRNTLRAGAFIQSFMTLLKTFRLEEGVKLEVRLEGANIFNNAVYAWIPDASVVGTPPPVGGKPSRFLNRDYTNNYPRSMNVQMKIIF